MRLPTEGTSEDETPLVAGCSSLTSAVALSGVTNNLFSHTLPLSSTAVNGILMMTGKCCVEVGHISQSCSVLCLQYLERQAASNKNLSVGAYKLNHAQESSYKICLSPLKTILGVSISGSTIPDTALLDHQADCPLI